MDQYLFNLGSPNPGRARNTDPDTSHEAAHSVDATALEAIVRQALKNKGPMTAREISDVTGIDLQTVTPRLAPLAGKNLARRTDMRRRGPTGRWAIVWEAI